MQKNSSLRLRVLGYLLAYCFALSLGLYFRLYPLREFTKPESRDRASVLVLHQIKQNMLNHIQKSNPGLNVTAQQVLARKMFDEYLQQHGSEVREKIEQTSHEMNAQVKEGRPTPYLLASDGYYYYALTQNIVEHGKIAARVAGSKYFNPLMLAPTGFWEPFNAHPYVGYLVYRFLKVFSPSIDLMYAVSFTPLFVTALCLLVFFLLCHWLRITAVNAFISGVFLLLAPIFVKRSMFAWYDNDPYGILLPLLVLYFLFRTFQATSTKYRVYFGGLTVLGLGLYSYFWQGWVFLLSVVIASLAAVFLYNALFSRDPKAMRGSLLAFGIIVLGDFLLVSILFGPMEFFTLFGEGMTALRDFISPQLSAWPDLFISVSELHPAGLGFVIEHTGGIFFFLVALIGFVHSLFFNKERAVGITLGIYGLTSFVIALGAQRFAILPLVPFAVAFALGLQVINDFLNTTFKTSGSMTKMIPAALLSLTILMPVYWMNRSLPTLLNPIFNQTWEKTLVKIREETPPKAIINTWWPPGHFIKAIARRAVTFDGATISVPQAYWLSNFFLKEDESEALAILRMLNSSGNMAVEAMQSKGLDVPTAVAAVEDLLMRPKMTAKEILLKTFKDYGFAKKMLKLTHGRPKPSYILIYNEFVENNLQLKFTGHYNFKEIQKINQDPERLKKLPPRRSPEFIKLLWQLAGGAHRYSGILPVISQSDPLLYFQENVVLDTKTLLVHVDSPKYGKGTPRSIFFLKDGAVMEKNLPGANLSFSALLFFRGNTPALVLLDRPLARSLLVQLYFFEGAGLKYIKPFSHERDLTGRTDIYVFEVDWKGYLESKNEGASDLMAEDCAAVDGSDPHP